MRPFGPFALALALGFCTCALAQATPAVPAAPTTTATGHARPRRAQARTPAPAPIPTLSPVQQTYLALAEEGVAAAEQHFGDRRRGWYDARLNDRERYPLATIWDIVPLFESLDAIAIAHPTAANRRAVARFAAGAERYLNRGLRPVPGYSPYPGDREAGTETWFDDNGWWGLAFVQAYRATGTRRYLRDAQRALNYVRAAGWDPSGGGVWWNTLHPYKAGEALASGTLLASMLYQQTYSRADLGLAVQLLRWANTAGFSPRDGLYAGSSVDPTPIDYIESPLIYAQALLCRLGALPSGCGRAEQLKAVAVRRFGQVLDFSPQYDAVYLQWMLALYELDRDPALYELAAENARDAQTRAVSAQGLYLLSWGGSPLPAQDALPGMLQTQAATTSVFAWLAVCPPPPGAS